MNLDIEIPITHYDITFRDIIETVFGSLLVIFGIVYSIVIANIITNTLFPNIKNNKPLNIFILFIHIINILLFIMFIRYIADNTIYNKLIRESIFSFIGPTIAASSLYYISNIKSLIEISK